MEVKSSYICGRRPTTGLFEYCAWFVDLVFGYQIDSL